MNKDNIKHFDGKKYLEIEPVRLHGSIYWRFIGADVLNPEVIFFESESGNYVEKDSAVYLQLCEKYALNKEFFHGRRVIDLIDLEKVKKLVTNVVLYGGIIGATLLGSIDTAMADARSYSMDSRKNIQSKWQAELNSIPSLKNVKVIDVESGVVTINERKYAKTSTIVNSGQNKGETLSTVFCDQERDLCYREYSGFFVNKVEEDLNNIFLKNDINEFSKNAAKDKDLSAIAKKRGIEDVEQWYQNKMSTVEYRYNPNTPNAAYYNFENNTIAFSSFLDAQSANMRAHEMSHAISFSFEKSKDSIYRDGLLVIQEYKGRDKTELAERGRAINEGVTMMFAEKLSGEKSKRVAYKQPTRIAGHLKSIYGAEILFESYLHDVNIIADAMNQYHKSDTAFVKFAHNLDEYLRLDNTMQYSVLNMNDSKTVMQLRDGKLKDAEVYLNNNEMKAHKGLDDILDELRY